MRSLFRSFFGEWLGTRLFVFVMTLTSFRCLFHLLSSLVAQSFAEEQAPKKKRKGGEEGKRK